MLGLSGFSMTSVPSTNWAGNVRYAFDDFILPASTDALCEAVKRSSALKTLGSRHSFNAIADGHVALSLENLPLDPRIEPGNTKVSVGGRCTYGELATFLNANHLAIHNLASLPHISIAGAIATATHGSGKSNGNLATAVSALEMVTADGSIVKTERGDPDFPGIVVHLGALGVVTRVTLDVVPEYQVAQTVYEGLAWDKLLDNLDEIMDLAYSVSVFTQWRNEAGSIWLKRTAPQDDLTADLFGATRSVVNRHPIVGLDPQNSSDQLGQYGLWSDRLPHFKSGFMPSSGAEIQSEYHVPRKHGAAAIAALLAVRQRFADLIQAGEFRVVAADDLWLSPQYHRDTFSIHFTWVRDVEAVNAILPLIEQALSPFEPLPHWGKMFAGRSYAADYPKLKDFLALRERLDPERKFSNRWLEDFVLGS
jgi:alditol oxidase